MLSWRILQTRGQVDGLFEKVRRTCSGKAKTWKRFELGSFSRSWFNSRSTHAMEWMAAICSLKIMFCILVVHGVWREGISSDVPREVSWSTINWSALEDHFRLHCTYFQLFYTYEHGLGLGSDSVLRVTGLKLEMSSQAHSIVGVALGLLLTFRTIHPMTVTGKVENNWAHRTCRLQFDESSQRSDSWEGIWQQIGMLLAAFMGAMRDDFEMESTWNRWESWQVSPPATEPA